LPILKRSSSAARTGFIAATAISLLGTPFRMNVCDPHIGMDYLGLEE